MDFFSDFLCLGSQPSLEFKKNHSTPEHPLKGKPMGLHGFIVSLEEKKDMAMGNTKLKSH